MKAKNGSNSVWVMELLLQINAIRFITEHKRTLKLFALLFGTVLYKFSYLIDIMKCLTHDQLWARSSEQRECTHMWNSPVGKRLMADQRLCDMGLAWQVWNYPELVF
jgi:hypothetical protein